MRQTDLRKHQKRALGFLRKARITVTPLEARTIEVADFGLNDVAHIGLELVVYENNDRYCAKELVMFPGQICPEHRHPPRNEGNPGKRETFRCRWGKVYLYVEGPPTRRPKGKVPVAKKDYFTVWHEIVLKPGDQFTLPPNTLHWFQSGPAGAVVSEFSSNSDDESDIFTDPNIKRIPVIEA
jgi:D-lyxose ketol-isomerase